MTKQSSERLEADLYVNTDFEILYEDESFFAINKPSPLPVHPVGRFKEKNLLTLLSRDTGIPQSSLRIVNRLDSETSGVVLVARSSQVAGDLGRQFQNRTVEKTYQAIVFGVPKIKKGKIDQSLGFKIENQYYVRTFDPAGETAETFYEVLAAYGDYSLLELRPTTGRTHQIRAHLAFMNHPIVGDKIYIDLSVFDRYVQNGWQDEMRNIVKMPRLCLHATRLKIDHPVTGQTMEFHCEMPSELKEFLEDPCLL